MCERKEEGGEEGGDSMGGRHVTGEGGFRAWTGGSSS